MILAVRKLKLSLIDSIFSTEHQSHDITSSVKWHPEYQRHVSIN
ncbi:hypothetical protein ACU8KH_04695 [Lachancea thermotolerans]